MRTAKIDLTKIEKSEIYVGQKGKYIELVFFENRDGTDQYGNDGFVSQSIAKSRRDNGERGPILGNWKESAQSAQSRPVQDQGGDDIPFAQFEEHSPLPL
jgi:hypothetical protein